ncbi:MAG: AI-2E family transporter [Burkholderiaceae bacterium]
MPPLISSPFQKPGPAASGSQLTAIVMFVTITGILYFGRDVLIPLALAVLLTFLLAPAVRRLEKVGLPRSAATAVMVGMSCLVIAGIVWVSATQLLNLAARLPEYKSNIQGKVATFRADPQSSVRKARRAIDEIEAEVAKQSAADARSGRSSAGADRPARVIVEATPQTPFEFLKEVMKLVAVPLTTAAAVILFTVIMMLRREDLRDRVIRLVGHRQLNVTTQVLEEAARRVSRYLRMQLIVNVTFGLPVGIALSVLGVPNAALWALLATVLRFIPYAGVWIAAAMPSALAFAISDDWQLVLWTVSVFLVLEIICSNIVEPWVYGASTGMSAIAIIVAAIFWTWLWGAVGLLLAVPLTVCLVVMGRYVPQLEFLNIMLGDQPVLSIQDRMYQRLLARDQEEAAELAEGYVADNGLEALYEDVLIPVLGLAERDRHDDALSEERAQFVLDTMRTLIEDLSEPVSDEAKTSAKGTEEQPESRAEAQAEPVTVCIVPARDEADELVGAMLFKCLVARNIGAELLTTGLLKSEALSRVEEVGAQAVYISALPPAAILHASFFCKRLRAKFPELKIVAALWGVKADLDRGMSRLQSAGASDVVVTLKAAIEKLPPAALVHATKPADASTQAGAGSAA